MRVARGDLCGVFEYASRQTVRGEVDIAVHLGRGSRRGRRRGCRRRWRRRRCSRRRRGDGSRRGCRYGCWGRRVCGCRHCSGHRRECGRRHCSRYGRGDDGRRGCGHGCWDRRGCGCRHRSRHGRGDDGRRGGRLRRCGVVAAGNKRCRCQNHGYYQAESPFHVRSFRSNDQSLSKLVRFRYINSSMQVWRGGSWRQLEVQPSGCTLCAARVGERRLDGRCWLTRGRAFHRLIGVEPLKPVRWNGRRGKPTVLCPQQCEQRRAPRRQLTCALGVRLRRGRYTQRSADRVFRCEGSWGES